jgi:hypothetical protein
MDNNFVMQRKIKDEFGFVKLSTEIHDIRIENFQLIEKLYKNEERIKKLNKFIAEK